MVVFLNAYIKKNLGDDLFIKLLSDRYKNHSFLISSKAKYLNQDDLVFYSDNTKIDYILKALSLGNLSFQSINMRKTDFSVLIGGSLFIERDYSGLKKMIYKMMHISKYDYIIGTNFGPYKTQRFLNTYRKVFKYSKDVCFRDKYSYDLFKDIKHCRYAPDILFSLDTSSYNIVSNKKVVFSVIDCYRRFSPEIADNYFKKIVDMILYFRENNYDICLMSFCKKEGDEDAIKRILDMIYDKKNIETYFYDGNLDEALNIISSSEIIVGTRFHANVLGMVFGKKVIPISYSDKTAHMLQDLGFNGVSYDIRKINSFDITKLHNLEDNIIDISKTKKEAELHFRELDKILK